jgi:hypothetical protein
MQLLAADDAVFVGPEEAALLDLVFDEKIVILRR